MRDFIPGLQGLGMEPSDAWFTMYGDQPQILAAFQASSMDTLQDVLDSADWKQLMNQLHDYVEDLDYKVVPARSGFQL